MRNWRVIFGGSCTAIGAWAYTTYGVKGGLIVLGVMLGLAALGFLIGYLADRWTDRLDR